MILGLSYLSPLPPQGYCAMAVASLLNLTEITENEEWKRHVAGFIAKCQTYEGGIAGKVN